MLLDDFNNFWLEHQKQPKLTISFIGQYNAGKSTLIKSLTGNSAILISPEICTDKVTEYSWNEVLLIDTPGIYADRKDHDAITLKKISESDLLVFVVPNELFNPQGGTFFKQVAQGMKRRGQMMLVINKMSRETGEIKELLKTISTVVEPDHYQDFYTCFIDANSYLQARYEKDKEEKEYLIEESNFNDFLNSLQILIDNNKLTAKLITPLHKLVDLLEQSHNLLVTNDESIADLLELLRRKKIIIEASQIRAKNIYNSALNELEHEIIMIGDKVADKIDGCHSEDEINHESTNAEKQITSLIETRITEINNALKSELDNLENELQQLGESPLGQKVEVEFREKKKSQDYNFNQSNSNYNYGKYASQALSIMSDFASKATRDVVFNVGKNLGVKFKPWGAFKMAKNIRGFAPLLAGLGFAVDIFMNEKEKDDERKYEQEFKKARNKCRENYYNLAQEIKNDYQVSIAESIKYYEEELWNINLTRNELQNNNTNQQENAKEIEIQLLKVKQKITELTKEKII
ncbi:GTPase [Geminocystis sp. CENA526]|uniref:GTPase n=1 Tax=Geminocystis sp. CENA526 TaxID=1355871 RepID=UPI003D6E4382